MRINQDFRTRKDVEEWMIYFEDGEVLEMPAISALITELLRVNRTRTQLVEWIGSLFPTTNAEEEVDEMISTYTHLQLLDGI